MNESIPLQCLEIGCAAEVVEVVGQRDAVHRLEEIGVRRGVEVEMVQAGRPCIVRVEGQRLCLRADELLNVLVRPGVVV